ncbi:MAG: TonB-dependent receptor plug domain-containing protein [Myxococcota bacterium]|nr:TonB-dependent receptor plug domain-containing protein [Myxococcota bacterium]
MRPSCFAPRAMAASAIATGALFFVSSPLVRAEVVDPTTGSDAAATDDSPAPPPVVRRIGEVAITAARSERELLDVPGNVTVIDRDTIERSGARDVPELLRREAGLFVTDGIGSPEGVRVDGRGFHNGGGNGSSLLILQDGRRLNEPDGTVMDWALVSLDRVERIEIVRGAASALYGDSANSGVVQILTKRGDGDGEAHAARPARQLRHDDRQPVRRWQPRSARRHVVRAGLGRRELPRSEQLREHVRRRDAALDAE